LPLAPVMTIRTLSGCPAGPFATPAGRGMTGGGRSTARLVAVRGGSDR
jgi:hypothetical protein